MRRKGLLRSAKKNTVRFRMQSSAYARSRGSGFGATPIPERGVRVYVCLWGVSKPQIKGLGEGLFKLKRNKIFGHSPIPPC